MVRSRGLAVIGAFVLIALAIFIRGRFADDDGGSGPKGSNKGDGSTPVVACTPDLQEVCDALADDGEIAKGTPTLDLDEAGAPPGDVDGWITWDPAPEIANFDAGQQPPWNGDGAEALGSAPLAALAEGAAFGYLRDGCSPDVDWACFATRFTSEGFSVGVGSPATAEGLSRLAPLAAALAPDLQPDDLKPEDVRAIVDSTTQDDVATMSLAATQPGLVGMVVGPEPALQRIADTPRGEQRGLQVSVLAPKATMTVVLAPRTGRDLGDLAEACEDDGVAEALEEIGVEACADGRDDVDRAGFLYRVREKAS